MAEQTRRVMTILGMDGKSHISNDEKLSVTYASTEFPGLEFTEVWRTHSFPIDLSEQYQHLEKFDRDLPVGQTRFGILCMPPLKDLLTYQASIGNIINDVKKFRLHKTNTIDYVTILSGQVYLVVDSGEEALLNSGDLVVQRGAMHSWHNHTEELCFMSIVQIGTREK